MDYRLIVVTHGGDEHTPMLQNTISSFEEMVTPAPTEKVLIEDGPKKLDLRWKGARFWSGEPRGFCHTAEMAWMTAAADTNGCEFAFWLEHDFMFRQPVDLRHLAMALDVRSKVAQMSLMRQPCNAEERKAGGVVALDPESFAPKIVVRDKGPRLAWLEHGRYWTTNPSLFRCSLARDNEWPVVSECEGVHTIGLRQQGYSFGVWGDGRPWVEHVGERTGFGY